VVRTRVGYAGGTTKNPTYRNIGDHTETMQVDYDPRQTSYEKLLESFWNTHNPCSTPYSRQYMSAIFYHNEAQKKLALQTRDAEQARRKSKIHTVIAPLTEFTWAEDYHQKYYLRQHGTIAREFLAIYPDLKDFVNSTAVMKVNAYVDGYGSPATLEKEINSLGLSPQAAKQLQEIVKQRQRTAN
jgi:peptide-methionine (S)-S-oxide reductase